MHDGSRQMRPHFFVNDLGHCAPGKAKGQSEFSMRGFPGSVLSSQRKDLGLCQFRVAVLLASLPSAVPLLVGVIFFSCPPAKIFNGVVGGVSVEMSAFATFRAFPNEGRENQAMDAATVVLSITDKRDVQMAVTVGSARLQYSPRGALAGWIVATSSAAAVSPAATDRPITTGFVADESWNVAVLNRRIVLHLKPHLFGVSRGRALARRDLT